MNNIKIYHLICPISGIVRYVGKTSKPLTRLKQHIRDAFKEKKGSYTKKQLWIRELNKAKKTPKMIIVSTHKNDTAARVAEHNEVMKNINTVFNIHLPQKGATTIEIYKKTQIIKAK